MHAALRGYMDDSHNAARRFHAIRLTAILWRFLEDHEPCIVAAAGIDRFDLVATVPSKSIDRSREAMPMPDAFTGDVWMSRVSPVTGTHHRTSLTGSLRSAQ
jgi:hypothetical protein